MLHEGCTSEEVASAAYVENAELGCGGVLGDAKDRGFPTSHQFPYAGVAIGKRGEGRVFSNTTDGRYGLNQQPTSRKITPTPSLLTIRGPRTP